MKPVIKCERDHQALRLYINGFLHLNLQMCDYVGFQAWYEGSRKRMFSIEFYTKDTKILLEYDEQTTWENVLKLLEENI